ncbi:MAG: hypothetical protein HC842_06890 [Cytophagales bacterium]|nr:hypothetical protein [Cytophagales bacterium]
MDYESSVQLSGNFLGDVYSSVKDEFTPSFALTSPWRVKAGGALFLGTLGLLTGEVEYVDYGGAVIIARDFSVSEDNEMIGDELGQALNIRGGAEAALGLARLRVGYAYFPDPWRVQGGVDRSRHNISAGLGLRLDDYYVDLTIVNSRYREVFRPYPTLAADFANAQNSITSVNFTMGFYF